MLWVFHVKHNSIFCLTLKFQPQIFLGIIYHRKTIIYNFVTQWHFSYPHLLDYMYIRLWNVFLANVARIMKIYGKVIISVNKWFLCPVIMCDSVCIFCTYCCNSISARYLKLKWSNVDLNKFCYSLGYFMCVIYHKVQRFCVRS